MSKTQRFRLPSPEDDNLLVRNVGSWSADKHHFLERYLYAFTTSMQSKWGSLHYIDLFAGPGVERVRNGGLNWGSPLIAAQMPRQFDALHLCDIDAPACDALRQRLTRFPQPRPPQVIEGDANSAVADVLQEIPLNSLSVAFLDPTGLHLHFETLRHLSQRRVDLIVYFPDYLDALRNIDIYVPDQASNLDKTLGTSAWRSLLLPLPATQRLHRLNDLYIQQIKTLGYEYFDFCRIDRPDGHPLYRLIFCARHPLAQQIWRGTSQIARNGQMSLDF